VMFSPPDIGVPRSLGTPGFASPAGVCAAWAGEPSRGGGRGKLPASGLLPRLNPRDPLLVEPLARRSNLRSAYSSPGRTSLRPRCTQPHRSPGQRVDGAGRQRTGRGSTPRYRAGHRPLPRGSTRVEGPLYPWSQVEPPRLETADSCQQASTALPTRSGAQLRARLRRAEPGTTVQAPSCQVIPWSMNVA
jgi:hypothetical protein